MKVSFKIHYPTAEELIQDVDAVSLIKYILGCYMDNVPLEGIRLHGMMDRMYLYNWSVAGAMMYRKIKTKEQEELVTLKEIKGRLKSIPKQESDPVFNYLYDESLQALETEIMIQNGVWGLNDVVDYSRYEFFLTDYGFELFTDVIKLEAKKTRRFMKTEELQAFQDDGRLETWLIAPKHEEITYPKSKAQEKAEFFIYKYENPEKRKLLYDQEDKGVVGWLAADGKFIPCGWAEHSKTAYEILGSQTDMWFDDAEQEFENQGYIKFWVMMSDYGVGGRKDIKPTKKQIKWFEKNIEILAKRQISMFESLIDR